jgi:hypothetical protein
MGNDEARIDFPAVGGAMLVRKDGVLSLLVCQQARGRMRWYLAFVLGLDTLPEPVEVPVLGRSSRQR